MYEFLSKTILVNVLEEWLIAPILYPEKQFFSRVNQVGSS